MKILRNFIFIYIVTRSILGASDDLIDILKDNVSNNEILERQLLITGCGCGGTKYIALVLRNCGLDVRHENIGEYGISSWLMAVDVNDVPYGKARNGMHFAHIFHQVRNPLDVISSILVNTPQRAWNFITKYTPQINDNDALLTKCAKYWYYWNLRIDEEAEWTYRIEDIENVWEEFQSRLGVKLDYKKLKEIPKKTNHKKPYKKLSWDDLRGALETDLYEKIRSLAFQYGYSLDDEE